MAVVEEIASPPLGVDLESVAFREEALCLRGEVTTGGLESPGSPFGLVRLLVRVLAQADSGEGPSTPDWHDYWYANWHRFLPGQVKA